MKPLSRLVALLLTFISVSATSLSGYQENTFDFGTAKQGAKIVHAFPIRNSGASPLTIQTVELSMPGMKARFKPVVIPGTEGSVTVEWDTSHLSGEIVGQVLVQCADNSCNPPPFLLKGVVKPPIEILPIPAVFLSEFQGEDNEQRLKIVNNETSPLMLRLSEQGSKHVVARLETVQPGRSYELVTRIASGTLPGRYDEQLLLTSDNAQIGTLTVPVHFFLKADLYANPDSVDFGQVSMAELSNPAKRAFLTQTFLVKKRVGNFQITQITSDVPGLEVNQDPTHQESSTYRIDVGLDPKKMKPGKLEGSLELNTTDAAFPIIKVPVTAYLF